MYTTKLPSVGQSAPSDFLLNLSGNAFHSIVCGAAVIVKVGLLGEIHMRIRRRRSACSAALSSHRILPDAHGDDVDDLLHFDSPEGPMVSTTDGMNVCEDTSFELSFS